ncbi:hypothetical protein MIR68_010778 [Amoeboaphelidium protococcarum]|nr:hypothetical protein MIR68_010778 [Amoeboaphelidium protococcarum]
MLNYFRTAILLIALFVLYYNFGPEFEQVGKVRRAATISLPRKCSDNKLFAFTFDEGPFQYTRQVLDALEKVGGKATFHVSSQFFYDQKYVNLVKEAYDKGHLIGLRFPPDVDPRTLTNNQFTKILFDESNKVYNIIKFYPRFLRLPYEQWEDRTINLAKSMDMIPTEWNIDAYDYQIQGSAESPAIDQVISVVKSAVDQAPDGSGSFISLHRDIYVMYNSVDKDVELLKVPTDRGYSLVDMANCLGRKTSAYRNVNSDIGVVNLNVTLTKGGSPPGSQTPSPGAPVIGNPGPPGAPSPAINGVSSQFALNLIALLCCMTALIFLQY